MSELRFKLLESFEKYSQNTAIKYNDDILTYKDLADKAYKISSAIKPIPGIKAKLMVLLSCPVNIIAAIIAAIKQEVVFIPVDGSIPQNRLQSLIDAVKPEWIITDSAYLDKLKAAIVQKHKSVTFCKIDELILYEYENLGTAFDNSKYLGDTYEDFGYIYFTSGSTGTPKGIMGSSKGLMKFINWEIERLSINEGFSFSQLTPFTFDPFLRDIFVPLCAGGSICIPSKTVFKDLRKLKSWIIQSKINVMHMVPSLFKAFVSFAEDNDNYEQLKYILLAGEMLKGKDLLQFFHKNMGNTQLINLYGPTETTLAKFYYYISKEDAKRERVPVGKPIDDESRAYVYNDKIEACKDGQQGEIYISTPFPSFGYYEDMELTKKLFSKDADYPHNTVYKTGDIGRLLSDGSLEVLGRLDNQFKIRGMKVQPEEVELIITKHPCIEDAGVFCIENNSHEAVSLGACIKGRTDIDTVQLKEYLSEFLPEYMVPVQIVKLEAIPKNKNGKLDRQAMKELAAEALMKEQRGQNPKHMEDSIIMKLTEFMVSAVDNPMLTEYIDFTVPVKNIFNSLTYIRFIVELEEEFDLTIDEEQLAIDYFDNIQAVVDFVVQAVNG